MYEYLYICNVCYKWTEENILHKMTDAIAILVSFFQNKYFFSPRMDSG